jgi:hypothetical protein
MTVCADIRARLAELARELAQAKADLAKGGSLSEVQRLQEKIKLLNDAIAPLRNKLEAHECFVAQPQSIPELEFNNPIPPGDFSTTAIAGDTFPSSEAKLEWKQVFDPHDEDYDQSNLVGATGWVLNPDFSKADFPFDHPFGFDWEFMLALDRPADNPAKYTFLLARGNQSSDDDAAVSSCTPALGSCLFVPNSK